MPNKEKRRRGDRQDAYRVRDLDSMHVIMPYLAPLRTLNEAVLNELVDLEPVEAYVAKKNADNPDFKYTIFHVLCAAIGKTIAMRPLMNRYISDKKYWDRKEITLTFVVKRQFKDDSHEALAIVKVDKDSEEPPIAQVYEQVRKFVTSVRNTDSTDGATDAMDILKKLPDWLLALVMKTLRFLDRHGKLPRSLWTVDPNYCTCFLSNLGSIKMKASYHHLSDWGTNSFFVVVGEKKLRPVFSADGTYTMKTMLPLGITVDERIADGLYYAGTVKLIKKILAHPEILEEPIGAPVSFDD